MLTFLGHAQNGNPEIHCAEIRIRVVRHQNREIKPQSLCAGLDRLQHAAQLANGRYEDNAGEPDQGRGCHTRQQDTISRTGGNADCAASDDPA